MLLCNCCYNCKKRTEDCHATCEEYLKFLQEKEKENELIRKSKENLYCTMHEKNGRIRQ